VEKTFKLFGTLYRFKDFKITGVLVLLMFVLILYAMSVNEGFTAIGYVALGAFTGIVAVLNTTFTIAKIKYRWKINFLGHMIALGGLTFASWIIFTQLLIS